MLRRFVRSFLLCISESFTPLRQAAGTNKPDPLDWCDPLHWRDCVGQPTPPRQMVKQIRSYSHERRATFYNQRRSCRNESGKGSDRRNEAYLVLGDVFKHRGHRDRGSTSELIYRTRTGSTWPGGLKQDSLLVLITYNAFSLVPRSQFRRCKYQSLLTFSSPLLLARFYYV